MGGPYLNSLIPIVGGVAASAWAPMSSVITPTATNAPLDHAGALVSSFMVLSLPPHASERSTTGAVPIGPHKVWRERIVHSGVTEGGRPATLRNTLVSLYRRRRHDPKGSRRDTVELR